MFCATFRSYLSVLKRLMYEPYLASSAAGISDRDHQGHYSRADCVVSCKSGHISALYSCYLFAQPWYSPYTSQCCVVTCSRGSRQTRSSHRMTNVCSLAIPLPNLDCDVSLKPPVPTSSSFLAIPFSLVLNSCYFQFQLLKLRIKRITISVGYRCRSLPGRTALSFS